MHASSGLATLLLRVGCALRVCEALCRRRVTDLKGVLVRFVDDEFDEDTPCTIGECYSSAAEAWGEAVQAQADALAASPTSADDGQAWTSRSRFWRNSRERKSTSRSGTQVCSCGGLPDLALAASCADDRVCLAGQEKFRSLTSSYYRGTNGIVLVFDVTDKNSFDNLDMWIQEIEMYTRTTEPAKLLIGNKIDKEAVRSAASSRPLLHARSLSCSGGDPWIQRNFCRIFGFDRSG